jgi:YidC/Oxa1 family membrane protein insertase
MLLYVLPLVFAVGGIAFPIGVLLYWTTSNLWTMGQQFYVIRNNPAPGTPAAKAKAERDARKHKGAAAPGVVEANPGEKPDTPQRTQPKKQTRSQRKQAQGKPAPAKPPQGKQAQGKPAPAKPPQGKPAQGKPAQGKQPRKRKPPSSTGGTP